MIVKYQYVMLWQRKIILHLSRVRPVWPWYNAEKERCFSQNWFFRFADLDVANKLLFTLLRFSCTEVKENWSLILRTHEFQVSHVTENCLCFTIGRFHVVLCLHLAHFWPLLGHLGAVLGHILASLGHPWTLRDAPKLVLGDTRVQKITSLYPYPWPRVPIPNNRS